jgi:predicted porin
LGGNNPKFSNSRVSREASNFDLPSVLMIGASYDVSFGEDHLLIPTASFVANTNSRDQIGVGLEYRFKKYLMIRGSYLWEEKNNKVETRMNAFTGLSGGISLELPFKKGGDEKSPSFGVDYSFRSNWLFAGTHCFGFRLNF